MARGIPDQDHFASGALRPSRTGKGSRRRPTHDQYAYPPDVQNEIWRAISPKQRELDAAEGKKPKRRKRGGT